MATIRSHLAESWGFWAACALALAVYAPTLGYHFSFDDFVPLSDMATKSVYAWLTDVLAMRDPTPSWRPLTMLVYRIEYAVFGMNAAAFRTVNLIVHIANVALVYVVTERLVRRTTVATLVAAGFGVFGGAWDTVSYVTALPHLLALACFLVSLWLLLEFVYTGEADKEIYWGSFAFFLLAFLANEASITFVVSYGLAYVLVARRPLDFVKTAIRLSPFALVAVLFGLVFTFCPCREQMTVEQRWDWISFKQAWLYLAWMLLPIGEAPFKVEPMDWVAGSVVVALGVFALVRGAAWARWAVVSLAVFMMPYMLIEPLVGGDTVVFPRYVYAGAFPFLLLLAWAGDAILQNRWIGTCRYRYLVGTFAAVVAAAAIAGYAVETAVQNHEVLRVREPAQELVSELDSRYRDAPFGSRVFLMGQPWTNPFFAFAGIPAVTKLVFGGPFRVTVEAWEPTMLDALLKSRGYRLEPWEHVLQYKEGHFRELTAQEVRREAQRMRSASQND